ncbi:hypothetical protein ACFQJ5_14975 [Halomicroarcula sp. GCM10025324]|uniref:hypothetical protein n=1 Tax=Haloarcula TaxID=2237 RepID=UPI0023E75DEF|nr:hypothetical protein [Halomicroarcula sp. ZS-22-S1]
MGQIINLDNLGGSYPDVLTSTGQGGFLSTGYLREKPAVSAIEADETPQYVITNSKNGVTVESDGTTEHIRPGSGYQTIAVLTDRRVVVLVGGTDSDGGDRQFAVPFAEIETVDSDSSLRHGRLTFYRAGGTRWYIHCERDGLEAVTRYLDDAAQKWIHVENTLDDVKRELVQANELRNNGSNDAALTAAKRASTLLERASSTASEFNVDREGDAMACRVEVVRERCLRTLSAIRLGRARNARDEGEARWRADEYEAAYDAYERARDEYRAVLSLDRHLADIDEILAERNRLDTLIEQLEQSPLRKAVAADNEAAAADKSDQAAEHWAEALDHYRTALQVDWGADERRFAGAPSKIRERLRVVAENLTAARRDVASDAMSAGDWFADAEQYEAALEEYADAREKYEAALTTARDCYPDAVTHLETELEALDQRVERTEAALAGEDVPDRIESDLEPEYDVEATIGAAEPDEAEDDASTVTEAEMTDPDEKSDIEAAIDAVESGDAPEPTGERDDEHSIAAHLRSLDRSAFVETVTDVLEGSGWGVAEAEPAAYDLLAERSDPTHEAMAVVVDHRPDDRLVEADPIETCVDVRGERSELDAVMFATSGRIGGDVSRTASEADVRLMDDECLSAIIEARGLDVAAAPRQVVEE